MSLNKTKRILPLMMLRRRRKLKEIAKRKMFCVKRYICEKGKREIHGKNHGNQPKPWKSKKHHFCSRICNISFPDFLLFPCIQGKRFACSSSSFSSIKVVKLCSFWYFNSFSVFCFLDFVVFYKNLLKKVSFWLMILT